MGEGRGGERRQQAHLQGYGFVSQQHPQAELNSTNRRACVVLAHVVSLSPYTHLL